MAKNRRKRLIIDRESQKRQIHRMISAPLLVLAVVATVTFTMSLRLLAEAASAQAELPSLQYMIMWMSVFLAAAGAAIVLQAVKFSNKIAGPAYRLKKSLTQLREGDFSFRVQLRTDDELIPVADELNRVLEWLEARESGAKATGDRTEDADDVKSNEENEEAAAPEPVS